MNRHAQLPGTTMIRSSGRGLATHVLVAVACAVSTPVWAGTLEGTAAYRERIALPPDAVFEAVLQDISRADAPAVVRPCDDRSRGAAAAPLRDRL